MTELVYSRKLANEPLGLVEQVREAFWATPLGLFIAALRQSR